MAQNLLRKFKDQVGRIVSVFVDTDTKQYTIQEQLYDYLGNSMLTNHEGNTVTMISYSFPTRKACFDVLNNKYKRQTKPLRMFHKR